MIPIYILLGLVAAETTYLVARPHLSRTPRDKNLVFVDTSVLIDGRIISLAESGFMPVTLAIPRSVLGELQLLADNGDTEKRTRARYGLDVAKELQALDTVKTIVFADDINAREGVDNRLLTLAKRHKAALMTIDFNLNKVAQVEGIRVLNINELAKSFRMPHLPGEHVMLELTQKGNDATQGVGHLEDGTMVVVEKAHSKIGKTVEVEFIRSLQTAAGKMLFARLVGGADTPKTERQQTPKKRQPQKQPQQNKTIAKKAEQPKQQKPAQKQAPQQRRNNRRRSPEDSLVDLANS